jgi:Tol biopolymer transport system component
MKKLLWLVLLCLLGSARLTAQTLLVGPLIAVDTAQQDRIILYDLSDSSKRELSFGARWHRIWDFSADGCRILLTLSDGMAMSRLYSARLDGSDLRELVQVDELPPENWSAWDPHWSPDGSRITFTMIRDQIRTNGNVEREYHIAWVDQQGGTPQFYSASADEHEPRWSPDGQWLAYIAYDERVAGADIHSTAVPTAAPAPGQSVPQQPLLREADLWVVSADGQTKYRLTYFDTGSARAPSWSHDGLLISFIYSPSPGNDQFWMIANAPAAIATQLSEQWSLILDTTWLPDSSAMISAVRDFQGTRDNRLWQIPLVGLADLDAIVYLNDPALGYADYPRFSPDGRWLALRSAYNLALVDTAVKSWTLLDENILGNTPPVWSPAGFAGEANCL